MIGVLAVAATVRDDGSRQTRAQGPNDSGRQALAQPIDTAPILSSPGSMNRTSYDFPDNSHAMQKAKLSDGDVAPCSWYSENAK